MRSEKRKSAGTAIESAATSNLKPWREVVTPHKDVDSGRYQQAEFAADLWRLINCKASRLLRPSVAGPGKSQDKSRGKSRAGR